MAVASLVLGILSVVMSFFVGTDLLGGLLGIIGIVLASLGKKNGPEEKRGMCTAGLVLSIIGTVLCLIFYVACAGCVAALAS